MRQLLTIWTIAPDIGSVGQLDGAAPGRVAGRGLTTCRGTCASRPRAQAAAGVTFEAAVPKRLERLPPSRVTAPMMTMAMSATIRPYSTAVAPRSDLRASWSLTSRASMGCPFLGRLDPAGRSAIEEDARSPRLMQMTWLAES